MNCLKCGAVGLKPHENWPQVKVLIDPHTETGHICQTNKDPKYHSSIRVSLQGKEYNAMYCRFGCGVLVVRINELPIREPKLLEYKTKRAHNYQRCGNILVDQGRTPPFQHNYALEYADYSPADREFLKSHYPSPEKSKWFTQWLPEYFDDWSQYKPVQYVGWTDRS